MALCRIIPAGDALIVDDEHVMLTGKEFVRQKISTRLKFFLGEWYRDVRQGVPYRRDVFVVNPNLDLIRSLFKSVILSVQEVTSVPMLELNFDRSSRKLAVEFDAWLGAGEVLPVRQPDPAFVVDMKRAA